MGSEMCIRDSLNCPLVPVLSLPTAVILAAVNNSPFAFALPKLSSIPAPEFPVKSFRYKPRA